MLFFINVPKIAVSTIDALSSDFSVCYTFVLKFRFTTQQIFVLLVGVQGLVMFPVAEYPGSTANTHTTVKPRFNGLMWKYNCPYWKMSVIEKDTDFT